MTEEELKNLIDKGGDEFAALLGRMQKYNANILGSNAYFHKKKKELEALMEQEGMCTMWFTLSAADNHWIDLFCLIHVEDEPLPIFANEKQKN